MNFLIPLHNNNADKHKIRVWKWTLEHLAKNADITNPEEVNQFIAKKKNGNYKNKLTHIYAHYLNYIGVEYKRPRYKTVSQSMKIPTKEKLQMLIANAGKTLSTKLRTSMETGLRPVEIHTLKVRDIDLSKRLVYPTTAKNGSPRTLKISESLTTLISEHIARNKLGINDQLFKGDQIRYGKEYRKMRNRTANKLKDPTLKTIRLYDFRHYFATMLYHKTKDILYVKQQMGHKKIETTLNYTQLIGDSPDEWTCKTATNDTEARQLVEAGFEYICTTPQDLMLFRKRK